MIFANRKNQIMKTLNLFSILVMAAAPSLALAGQGTLVFPNPPVTNPPTPPPPPRIWVDTNYQPPQWEKPQTPSQPGQPYVYQQQLYGGNQELVSSEHAQKIVDNFRAAYPKLGSPRILIYVNRELVDENSGMKLTHGTQHIESTKNFGAGTNETGTIRTTTDQSFHSTEKSQPTLADKQTVRDVERLFGRPLRQAGASLVDQKVASELIADKPISEFVGASDSPESRKDREAIGKIADAVIEILIASKNATVTTVSGEQTITIPDIQATAIRLSDSRIIGQASSSDVTDRVPPSSLQNFGVPEITEATALALMEDMTPAAQ